MVHLKVLTQELKMPHRPQVNLNKWQLNNQLQRLS